MQCLKSGNQRGIGVVRILLLLALVVVVIVALPFVSILGAKVFSSIGGQSDHSVELPPDAEIVARQYQGLIVAGRDGEEELVVMAPFEYPSLPPDPLVNPKYEEAASAAEQVLGDAGVNAHVFLDDGSRTEKPALIISLDQAEGLETGFVPGSPEDRVNAAIDELISLSEREGLDLGGVGMVYTDETGKPLVSVGASVEDLKAFRNGEIPLDEAVDHVGISIVDRGAILDLIGTLRDR